jgi:ech hydrogenase subunit D
MTQNLSFEIIPVDALLDRVRFLRETGYRPVQIGATRLPDRVELTYSFDRDGELLSLRLQLPPVDTRVPSISSIFACVLLYENELHDLFNVRVDNMAVDFHGNLYKTAVKFPFGTTRASPAKPGATPAPATAKSAATGD